MPDADNPVLCRLTRGTEVESVHRGAWVLVDTGGTMLDGVGRPDQLVFARSSSKSLQALPLVETGAAGAFGFDERALALAIASHTAEPEHLAVVTSMLTAAGMGEDDLQCGPQPLPGSPPGAAPRRLANTCSGKHAGFLATGQHVGAEPAGYLTPDGPVQRLVADAMATMTDLDPSELVVAVDGCSAPTFGMPLRSLAMAIGRVASPGGLEPDRQAACRRLVGAAGAHPWLVGGHSDRMCSALMAATGGRLFAKMGAEGVLVVALVGGERALAVKVDDGATRGYELLVTTLLEEWGWLTTEERSALGPWGSTDVTNWDGLVVGRAELAGA